ncbi:unnamed protein product [Ambrosiozyma monospora]|uniref:Unnamed protein product n=1 Tax=Ambrosiozyma monospora TaxID=43982 RepID=A0ACB5T3D6_AMBMO|nr:unnamed protein product [Ambrosiozyma monospora]
MNFLTSIATTALIMISGASAEKIQLDVRSEIDELSGAGVFGLHEGPTDYYLFAVYGKHNSTKLDFDNNTISVHGSEHTFYLGNSVGELDLTFLTGPLSGYSFSDDGLLQLNGTSDKFYACYNSTEDPTYYSDQAGYYQLFYDHIPRDTFCAKVELVKDDAPSTAA